MEQQKRSVVQRCAARSCAVQSLSSGCWTPASMGCAGRVEQTLRAIQWTPGHAPSAPVSTSILCCIPVRCCFDQPSIRNVHGQKGCSAYVSAPPGVCTSPACRINPRGHSDFRLNAPRRQQTAAVKREKKNAAYLRCPNRRPLGWRLNGVNSGSCTNSVGWDSFPHPEGRP